MIALLLAVTAASALAGDFDGDGRADTVSVAPQDGGYVLLIQRAGAEAPDAIIAFSDPQSFHLKLQPPGSYRTLCGESGDCGRGQRRRVKVRGDVLAFGTSQAPSAVAVWNGKAFEVEWLAD